MIEFELELNLDLSASLILYLTDGPSIADHKLALSFSDLSVWCYSCDNYVDNDQLYQIKNAAHKDKFGEEMLRVPQDSQGTVDLQMI